MLKTKTNPVGIDIPIQSAQSRLHAHLLTKWGIASDQYIAYGRCYRNKKQSGYVAEWYEGANEYRDAYWNDTVSAISFFGIDSRTDHELGDSVQVHLIFFVNLSKLKPTIAHRGDAEVRKDVTDFIGKGLNGLQFDSVDIWADRCLREYPGTAASLNAVMDMHPLHCFRINFTANYSKNIC